ncbi:eCIS core domain-containing protein [Desulfogranum japonicum]|uniref:eCIS core domain-containing protein n=1 Tax=Desulfogranum japonicum TaxID=231447 RepID=UPI0004000186|nr:DUF4157 domain-containing protein [Desulfogranum japonicum]
MKQTTTQAGKQPDSLWSGRIPQHAAVQPLLEHAPPLIACTPTPPRLQAKLKIGEPNDQYEQEADRVADQVMRMPEPQMQRKDCSTPVCEDQDEEQILQPKSLGNSSVTHSVNHPLIQNVLSSPGQPLDADIRSFMEPRFGWDFSGVRVHTDRQAAKSAQVVNALAYTVGKNVIFASGQYSPSTGNGRRLLGHELSHVVQQNNKSYGSTNIKISRQKGSSRAKATKKQISTFVANRFFYLASLGKRKIAEKVPSGWPYRSDLERHWNNTKKYWWDEADQKVRVIDVNRDAISAIPFIEKVADYQRQLNISPSGRLDVSTAQALCSIPSSKEERQPTQQQPQKLPEDEALESKVPKEEIPFTEKNEQLSSTGGAGGAGYQSYSGIPPGAMGAGGASGNIVSPYELKEQEKEGLALNIQQALKGEFEENPQLASIIIDTAISLIPYVDQAADARDLTAHVYFIALKNDFSTGRWVGLAFTLFGLVPEVGSLIKGLSKVSKNGVTGAMEIFRKTDGISQLVPRQLSDNIKDMLLKFSHSIDQNWGDLVDFGIRSWDILLQRVIDYLKKVPASMEETITKIMTACNESPKALERAFQEIKPKIKEVVENALDFLSEKAFPSGGKSVSPEPIPVYAVSGYPSKSSAHPSISRGTTQSSPISPKIRKGATALTKEELMNCWLKIKNDETRRLEKIIGSTWVSKVFFTTVLIEIVDKNGKIVLVKSGFFRRKLDPSKIDGLGEAIHAEEDALFKIIDALKKYDDVKDGSMKIVIDQFPCQADKRDCEKLLDDFAKSMSLKYNASDDLSRIPKNVL